MSEETVCCNCGWFGGDDKKGSVPDIDADDESVYALLVCPICQGGSFYGKQRGRKIRVYTQLCYEEAKQEPNVEEEVAKAGYEYLDLINK